MQARLVSGIKPTGDLTLGNYLGAIKKFIKLQNNFESYIFVADLHALTDSQMSAKELKENRKKNNSAIFSVRTWPAKSKYFLSIRCFRTRFYSMTLFVWNYNWWA